MINRFAFCAWAMLSVVGCGPESLVAHCGASDLAIPSDLSSSDLLHASSDLLQADDLAGLGGCKNLWACTSVCNPSEPFGTPPLCWMQCTGESTPRAVTEYDNLTVCLLDTCVKGNFVDGGHARCSTAIGDPSPACAACWHSAMEGETSPVGPCSPAGDPACGACVRQATACFTDTR